MRIARPRYQWNIATVPAWRSGPLAYSRLSKGLDFVRSQDVACAARGVTRYYRVAPRRKVALYVRQGGLSGNPCERRGSEYHRVGTRQIRGLQGNNREEYSEFCSMN